MSRQRRNTTTPKVNDVTTTETTRKRANDESPMMIQIRFKNDSVWARFYGDDVDDDGYARIIDVKKSDVKVAIKKKINGQEVVTLVTGYDALNTMGEYLTDTAMESRQKVTFHALVNDARRETKRTIDPTQSQRATREKLDEMTTLLDIMSAVASQIPYSDVGAWEQYGETYVDYLAHHYADVTQDMYDAVYDKLTRLTDVQHDAIQDAIERNEVLASQSDDDDDDDIDDDDETSDDETTVATDDGDETENDVSPENDETSDDADDDADADETTSDDVETETTTQKKRK
jgi:hypothetical protein